MGVLRSYFEINIYNPLIFLLRNECPIIYTCSVKSSMNTPGFRKLSAIDNAVTDLRNALNPKVPWSAKGPPAATQSQILVAQLTGLFPSGRHFKEVMQNSAFTGLMLSKLTELSSAVASDYSADKCNKLQRLIGKCESLLIAFDEYLTANPHLTTQKALMCMRAQLASF